MQIVCDLRMFVKFFPELLKIGPGGSGLQRGFCVSFGIICFRVLRR